VCKGIERGREEDSANMYAIVNAETGERLTDYALGIEKPFASGAEAASAAKLFNAARKAAGSPLRARVVKVTESQEGEETRIFPSPGNWAERGDLYRDGPYDYGSPWRGSKVQHGIPADGLPWRRRECAKQNPHTREHIPWLREPWWSDSPYWVLHYPRLCEEDPEKLVYTPSEEWGQQDRQLRTRPGRYLRKHFGTTLNEEEIDKWVQEYNKLNGTAELLLATTADDIEHVYTHGPNSCMSHRAGEYNSPFHPGPRGVLAGPEALHAYVRGRVPLRAGAPRAGLQVWAAGRGEAAAPRGGL
jgi:hypothetical protein